jgi:prolyl oligopeptidase
MKVRAVFCFVIGWTLLAGVRHAAAQLPALSGRYPATARGAVIDDVGGVQVADPFRWLENPATPEVHTWIAAQSALSTSYLAQLPRRQAIGDVVARLSTSPNAVGPFAGGERIFYFENNGLDNQPILYVQDRAALAPRVLLDPNVFSREGLIAVVDQAASPDGHWLAYAVSTQGSSWRIVRVRETRTTQDQPDELHDVKDGKLLWTHDNRGFFYTRTDSARADYQRLYFHRLGRKQSEDQLVYENVEHPDWRVHADLSEDGQYLVIALAPQGDTRNRLYFIDLDNPGKPNLRAPIVKLFDGGDAIYQFVSSRGPVFYVRTSKSAPRTRVVAVDINTPDENHWTNIVRETYDPLVDAVRVDDRLIAHRLHDAHSVLELFTLTGAARGTVPLPGVGTVSSLSAHNDAREMYFVYTSFLQPRTYFRYDLESRNAAPFHELRADTALAQFETTQLFFTSKDGTRVPMFITARRGIKLDGSNAALLSTYGSFGVANTPNYSPLVGAWLSHGGIYAVANVRGGGEYGPTWHDAAVGAHKQVAIDDFLAAAEFLISQRYTHAGALGAIADGAGGLVVAAGMTQHPSLFSAVAIDNGFLDATRAARSIDARRWIAEFGSPTRDQELRALLAYSPVNNAHATSYPATLVSIAENDDVVPPFHGYKWAAALQGAQTAAEPVLLRIEPNVGHGATMPMMKRLALQSDELTFLLDALGVR